ncbi:MAG TPA: hypothetical protein VNF47_17305 [Streptosporangiaceae bacterium]|nr:hypothetical protein [Streptosporangiaceae bacterium]
MRPIKGPGGFLTAFMAVAALTAGAAVSVTASASVTVPNARNAESAGKLPDYGKNDNVHADISRYSFEVNSSHPDQVVGTGTPAGCTSAAVVRAVALGGVIVFRCGPRPVTIRMSATAKAVNTSRWVVLDGGGKVTLNGGGARQILYMNTCDRAQKITTEDCYDQQRPRLIVQNITMADGYSAVRQTSGTYFGGGGGGAIFDLGGQLRVVNSRFVDNRCYRYGPDLAGAAIRALVQWQRLPVYVVGSTFTGGRCSNGGALSSIGVSWVVLNCVMTNNGAIGYGANPAVPHTPGGGSGGAIYTDGDRYTVRLDGTLLRGNFAREGGGAVFFVSDDRTGTLTVQNSWLRDNPSGVFWTRAYPGIYFHSSGRPAVINSTIRS